MTTIPGMNKSWKLHDRALQVIPMATQTHSKAPREELRGIEPCFLVRGKGSGYGIWMGTSTSTFATDLAQSRWATATRPSMTQFVNR